jgi:hypothetical protein
VNEEQLRLVEYMQERWGARMDAHVAQAPPIAPEVAERISALLSEGRPRPKSPE